MRPEEIARSIEGVALGEPADTDDAGTAPRIVYAHANAYAVPSGDDNWTTRNRLIIGIEAAGEVQRWEIDTEALIESSGPALDAESLRAGVKRLYAEGSGHRSQESEIFREINPAPLGPPSPGPGDPELDL